MNSRRKTYVQGHENKDNPISMTKVAIDATIMNSTNAERRFPALTQLIANARMRLFVLIWYLLTHGEGAVSLPVRTAV